MRMIGSLLVILAAICFGFLGLFGSWATGAGVSVEMMLFLRFALAGGLMAIYMFARGLRWPRGKLLLGLFGMGAILYVGEAMFWFHAARHIPAGLVSLLLYIYPVIVTIFAWLLFKERLTIPRLIALALACAGLILTIAPMLRNHEAIAPGANPTLGVILGLLCCLSYAIFILCGGALTRKAGAIPAATVVILSAAVVLGVFALSRGEPLPSSPRAWAGILALAIASTLIAITAVLYGLERIGPVQTSTLSTFEPVVTVIIGALLMDQRMSALQLLGGALIVTAAVIVARSAAKTPAARASSGADVLEMH